MLLIEMDENLRVALGAERVAALLQVGAKLSVVVDLAVQDDREAAVLVVDRLITGLEVDHAKPLDPEHSLIGSMDSPRVRAPVNLTVAHSLDQTNRHRRLDRHLAGYPAHAANVSARRGAGPDLALELTRLAGRSQTPCPLAFRGPVCHGFRLTPGAVERHSNANSQCDQVRPVAERRARVAGTEGVSDQQAKECVDERTGPFHELRGDR